MRALWGNEAASFHGKQFDFKEVYSFPKPAQKAGIPIMIGGYTPAAARRAGRIGDGFFPLVPDNANAKLKELIELMRAEARKHGRNPDQLEVSTGAPAELDAIKVLEDLGVSRVILRPPSIVPAELGAGLEKIANTVIAKL